MRISLSEGAWDKSTADIVAIAIPSGKTRLARAVGRIEAVAGKGIVKPLASDERFEGKPAQRLKVSATGPVKARWLLLVGIGDEKDAKKIAWELGHAVASTARAQKSAALELPEVTSGSVRAASQGLMMGAYRYTQYKSDKATATTISPWIVTKAALEPFRTATPPRERDLLPYLAETTPGLYDIDRAVTLAAEGKPPSTIARTNYREMY